MKAARALAGVLGVPVETAERIRDCVIRGWLEHTYPIPDVYDTHEQWQRRLHHDLTAMSRAQLLLEQRQLETRLMFDRKPHLWLLERHERVQEVLRHAR
jgi:hypothetical protein